MRLSNVQAICKRCGAAIDDPFPPDLHYSCPCTMPDPSRCSTAIELDMNEYNITSRTSDLFQQEVHLVTKSATQETELSPIQLNASQPRVARAKVDMCHTLKVDGNEGILL